MSEPIQVPEPDEAPILVQARAVAEMAADYVAEQLGPNGVPWSRMPHINREALVISTLTHLGIKRAILDFEEGRS